MAIAFLDLAASIPIRASLYSNMARPLCAEDRLGQSEQPSSRIVGRATSSAAERTYGYPECMTPEFVWDGPVLPCGVGSPYQPFARLLAFSSRFHAQILSPESEPIAAQPCTAYMNIG